MSEAQNRSQLAWRCRRGRREWDLLLLDWLARHFESATEAQRARFAGLLELPDPELEQYLLACPHPLQADLAAPGGDAAGFISGEPSPPRTL